MSVAAIIFDFDGVIIDTETPDFETWRDLFYEQGLDLTPDLWVQRVGATANDMHFSPERYYEQLTGSALDEAALKQQRANYLARCQAQPVLPGVIELITFALEHDIQLAIASNSYSAWVERYAKAAGLRDYFECVRTLDDVSNGKPAPDVYLSAAACLGVPVERCIAIEDSPTGMKAALAAGIRVVAVLNALTAPLMRPDEVSLTMNALSEMTPQALMDCF